MERGLYPRESFDLPSEIDVTTEADPPRSQSTLQSTASMHAAGRTMTPKRRPSVSKKKWRLPCPRTETMRIERRASSCWLSTISAPGFGLFARPWVQRAVGARKRAIPTLFGDRSFGNAYTGSQATHPAAARAPQLPTAFTLPRSRHQFPVG